MRLTLPELYEYGRLGARRGCIKPDGVHPSHRVSGGRSGGGGLGSPLPLRVQSGSSIVDGQVDTREVGLSAR